GIRARNVTGVQTCALPIFPYKSSSHTFVVTCAFSLVSRPLIRDLTPFDINGYKSTNTVRPIRVADTGRVKNWERSQLVLITDCMKFDSTLGPSTMPRTTGANGTPQRSKKNPTTASKTTIPISK